MMTSPASSLQKGVVKQVFTIYSVDFDASLLIFAANIDQVEFYCHLTVVFAGRHDRCASICDIMCGTLVRITSVVILYRCFPATL